jgi:hypothetical protein
MKPISHPFSGRIDPVASPSADQHALATVLADGTPPVAVAVAGQDDLLAAVEARLAQEVGDLAAPWTASLPPRRR